MMFSGLLVESCSFESTECGLGDSQKGADAQGTPHEEIFSFATPPEAPFADLFALKLAPLGYRLLQYCGLKIFKLVSAPQLHERRRLRLYRFEVIAGFAQKEQVISAAFVLDH